MTNFTENNVGSSSSSPPTPTEMPQGLTVFDLPKLKLELSEINEGLRSFHSYVYQSGQFGNWALPNIRIPNEVDDDNTSGDDDKDTVSGFNPNDLVDDSQSVTKCPVCDFDIDVSALRDFFEDYDAHNMVCPVCEENLGEDAFRVVQNFFKPKPTWRLQKHGGWTLHGKKSASLGNKDEPSSDSASKDNAYGPSFNDFFSDEDTISNASDVTIAKDISIAKSFKKDAPDTGNELDVQEKSNRAAFAQEMLMSALFSE